MLSYGFTKSCFLLKRRLCPSGDRRAPGAASDDRHGRRAPATPHETSARCGMLIRLVDAHRPLGVHGSRYVPTTSLFASASPITCSFAASHCKLPADAIGDVAEAQDGVRVVAVFDVGDRPVAALDAVQEVAHVRPVLLRAVGHFRQDLGRVVEARLPAVGRRAAAAVGSAPPAAAGCGVMRNPLRSTKSVPFVPWNWMP